MVIKNYSDVFGNFMHPSVVCIARLAQRVAGATILTPENRKYLFEGNDSKKNNSKNTGIKPEVLTKLLLS
jgi:hypothetical protein